MSRPFRLSERPVAALHIEDSGGDGAAVVLVHSSGLSGRQWRRLASALVARGFRAIVPDLTGHGASEPWPEPKAFSLQIDVDALVALFSERGPVHVVGHSYGAFLALLAAAAAPESVRSLALFEPVAFGSLDPVADIDALAELEGVDSRWGPSAADREHWLRMFVDYWGGDGAWAALREGARADFRRVAWVAREGVHSLVEDATPASAYGGIRCPVVLMTGERAPLAARRVVQRVAESLSNARVVVVPEAGHMAPLTHADRVNDVVLDALASTEPPPRS